MLKNIEYEILTSLDKFSDFMGVEKSHKDIGYKVTLENNMSIIVGEDHIFLAGSKNMYVKSLVPNISYITTIYGDFYVKEIKIVEGCDFYDIVDSINCEYLANDILNHNCSFLGSGDNFIAEEYVKRIEDEELRVPIRQEYADRNMWIFEDYIEGAEYVITCDVAAGHGEESSTVTVLKLEEIVEQKIIKGKKYKVKKTKAEQVAEYAAKCTPQMLAEVIYYYGKQYGNAYAVVDITGGYGIQTIEKLIEFGYENIHFAEVIHKPSRDRLVAHIKLGQKKLPDGSIINVDLIPGFFIGNNRASVLLEMQRSIHLCDVIIRSTRLSNELKTFVNVAGSRVADHKRSFHDNLIMGLAIGLYTINFEMKKYRQDAMNKEKMLAAYLTTSAIKENVEKIEAERIKMNKQKFENVYGTNAWLFNTIRK